MTKLLTIEQLGDNLQVTRQCIYNWLKRGMPVYRKGRVTRFSETEVMQWLKSDD